MDYLWLLEKSVCCGSFGACGFIFSPLSGKEVVPLTLVKLGTLLSIDEISAPLRYERAFV